MTLASIRFYDPLLTCVNQFELYVVQTRLGWSDILNPTFARAMLSEAELHCRSRSKGELLEDLMFHAKLNFNSSLCKDIRNVVTRQQA